jgi:hypothetical protein
VDGVTARIPFALLGVVLLLGSASLAGSIHQPVITEPAVDQEMERAAAELQSAIRDGITMAARNAVEDPVIRRANSSFGRIINRTEAFEDALRIRIYLRIRENLAAIEDQRGEIRVAAKLPAIRKPGELRKAKRRVQIERAGPNDTRLRVHIDEIELKAIRDGRTVGHRAVSPTVVAATPVLTVHQRVASFERKLSAKPFQPGLGRRLTGNLYPVVWARGYAQYGGAPIENVLANRHVSLFANRAILALQHETFGQSDPIGRTVYKRAFAETAVTDALANGDSAVTTHLRKAHERVGLTPDPTDALGEAGTLGGKTSPTEKARIGINRTADRVFLSYLPYLNTTIQETYTAHVELRADVTQRSNRSVTSGPRVRSSWSREETRRRQEVTVTPRRDDTNLVIEEGHTLAVHSRLVQIVRIAKHVWETPNGKRTTTERNVETYAVDLATVGSHQGGPAPPGPIQDVHTRGGPLAGPNMADVPARAHDSLIPERGGVDKLARKAALGTDVTASTRVTGDRSDRLRKWIYSDLVQLREQVANVSVKVSRGQLATFQTNPAEKITNRLQQRRESLLEAPDEYGNVAGRSRIAARAAYLDRVVAHFNERAREYQTRRGQLDEAMKQAGGFSLAQLQRGYAARNPLRQSEQAVDLRMRVHATPGYLPADAIGSDTVPYLTGRQEGYALAVRNWNAISVPYGNIADAVVSRLFEPEKTRFRAAAQTLAAIERNLARGDATAPEATELREEVARGIGVGQTAAAETLRSFDLGKPQERQRVVERGLGHWSTTGTRALALANGSAATKIHAAAVECWGPQLSSREEDLLALRLSRTIQQATTSEAARVPEPAVEDSAEGFRKRVRDWTTERLGNEIANVTRTRIEQIAGRSLSRLPAGLPVAPAPGMWYATVNLWQVRVRGEYARFAVSVPRGTPDEPGARFLYVRDGKPVLLDVDNDGERERLGQSARVSFETGTTVGIAVPPGPQGVGDIDGEAEEQSSGWPNPGW